MPSWMRPTVAEARHAVGFTAPYSLALILLSVVACDDTSEPPLPCTPSTIGALQGYIRVAGRPVAIAIGARMIDSPGTVVAQTRSDSAGWYQLALPPETYRIELNPSPGGHTSSDLRDTVRVEAGVRRLDVWRGHLTVRVNVPPAASGRFFTCSLDPDRPFDYSTVSAGAHDGQVQFVFAGIDPGPYRLRLQPGAFVDFWLPGTTDPSAADRVVVGRFHPAVYETRLQGYASISGSVRGSWQEAGAVNPRIVAYTPDSPALGLRESGRTLAASDGSFKLGLLGVQSCKLQVSISGVNRWIGGDTFDSATTFYPPPGSDLGGVSVVESGIVCRLEGPGSLLSHRAEILLRDATGDTVATAVNDANPLPICNLQPGLYKLYVHGDCDYDGEPWASQWYEGADSMTAATTIEVTEGHATRITMHLDRDGRIEGRVLDASGEPASVAVALYRRGVPLCANRRYGGPASFSLRGLGNGDYTLAADFGARLWWYPGTALADSARVLSIREHATLGGIEWRLPSTPAKEQP